MAAATAIVRAVRVVAAAETGGAADVTAVAARLDAGLRRSVLDNGLTVLTDSMPWVRSVALGAWVRSASVHESREKMGVSHLLEHMVFKGTRTRSAKEIALALEVLGGSLDAYTSREHTSFQARVLDEHVPQAADVLADIVFNPALRTRDLELERKVVLEEINMVEDTPDDLVFELHNAALWGAHPYGYSILGTRETVIGLTPGDLEALHGRAYLPPGMVVAAAGNIEHEQLLAVLQRTGWFREAAASASPSQVMPPMAEPPVYRHVPRDIAQTHIVFGSPTCAHGDPRRYPLLLVSVILGGGMSSRLFQRVREELGLAYSIQCFHSFHADAGLHGVYVASAPETASEATSAIAEELQRLVGDGLTEEELASGKSQLKGNVTIAMESVSARMYRAAGAELYGEPYQTVDEVLALIDAITLEEAQDVCRAFLDPRRHTVLSLGKREITINNTTLLPCA